jgi:protein TonB
VTATKDHVSLFEFMPYGAPELMEAARRYMARGVAGAIGLLIVLFGISMVTNLVLSRAPKEVPVIVVPFRELSAPPPLQKTDAPPQVAISTTVTAPTVGIPVPVPDAEAPMEQTIASQDELARAMPSTDMTSDGSQQIVVAPPTEEELPRFGEYVYVEELPEAIHKQAPQYPDLAREASVDGTVMVQALVGKDGRVKDTRVVKSIPMLDAAAIAAVRQWVFKPALSNNKPVAVWVAVPVKFTLH